jgi:hypothetical protein
MLNVVEEIYFFGFPAQHQKFGKFLFDLGIEERPVFEENPIDWIEKRDEGFSFIFETKHAYVKNYGKPQEGGDMVFRQLQLQSGKKSSQYGRFSGPLPLGMTFEATENETKLLLGTPDYEEDSETLDRLFLWKNIDGIEISIVFLNDDRGIDFINIKPVKLTKPI